MVKEQLTPKDIDKLANILESCACIRIEGKSCGYGYSSILYVPSIRVQSIGIDVDTDIFGGSVSERFFRGRRMQTWTWNIQMIKQYLPLIIPHLVGKTKEKAELVLEATKCCRGRGVEQDKEKLKELYEKIQPLQEPRIRRPDFPWLERQEFPFV